jgi:hypothetical protein
VASLFIKRRIKRMSEKLRKVVTGENATKITPAEGTVTGTFDFMNAIEDSTVSVVVNWKNATNPETVTLSAGQSLPGVFLSITVTSGRILAF